MGGAEILHKLALDSASQVIGGIKGGKGLEMNARVYQNALIVHQNQECVHAHFLAASTFLSFAFISFSSLDTTYHL